MRKAILCLKQEIDRVDLAAARTRVSSTSDEIDAPPQFHAEDNLVQQGLVVQVQRASQYLLNLVQELSIGVPVKIGLLRCS